MSPDMLIELKYLEWIIYSMDQQIQYHLNKYDEHYVYIIYTVFRGDCAACPHNSKETNCDCFEVVSNLINLLNEKIDERMKYYYRYEEIKSILTSTK